MSSLQKFHRRTASFGPSYSWPTTSIGMGDLTHGFWLGDISSNKLIVAPKSTEVQTQWGSRGTYRNTTSNTNGLTNTNTLVAFGSSITTGHPAAYAAKNLTTGGYNTWYLPAREELNTLYSNKSATPFAIANSFDGGIYWSSTEGNGSYGMSQYLNSYLGTPGGYIGGFNKYNNAYVRAVRRSTI